MTETIDLLTSCPKCGRRYLPPRVYCSACLLVQTAPSAPRGSATVLSFSMLQRAGSAAVIETPKMIVLLQEEGDGASFLAPLEGNSAGLRLGEIVDIGTHVWSTGSGTTFTGVVARRRTGK